MEWFIWPFVVIPIAKIVVIGLFGFLIWDELAKRNLQNIKERESIDNQTTAILSLNEKPKRKTTKKKGTK